MERVEINNEFFNVNEIQYISPNVIKIDFNNEVPTEFGNISVFTSGGELTSELYNFETVWKKEDKTVWLSNNKSVFPDTDLIDYEIVDGNNSYYSKLNELSEKIASTEEELTNTQLALTELAALAASK
ncbi:MAG: hypothetical protein KHZ87_08685 [Clostridiales bacterium]|nr:hypothetical protein [Clostridiales bacterium]